MALAWSFKMPSPIHQGEVESHLNLKDSPWAIKQFCISKHAFPFNVISGSHQCNHKFS